MITHLEPDILECEVKWALESINTNKASGGDGIPVELFQILEDDTVKVLHSICQQIKSLNWEPQAVPQKALCLFVPESFTMRMDEMISAKVVPHHTLKVTTF